MSFARALSACLVVVGLLSVLTGCTHRVVVRSEPPGADVYVLETGGEEGTLFGPTPVTLEMDYGLVGSGRTVVVHDGETAVRFEITRGRVTPESFTYALVDNGAQFVCCGTLAAGFGALSFWLWPLLPVVAWPSAVCAGCAGLVAAFQPLSCAFCMWAPPDVVNVNMRSATASSQPGDMVERVERVDGPPPLAPLDDEYVPDETERPALPLSEGGAVDILYRPGVLY